MDLEDFRSYIVKSFGLSEGTGKMYVSCIKNFFTWVSKPPEQVTIQDFVEFFQYLYDRKYSANTMITYLSALRAYYDYLTYKGVMDRNPAREFKRRFRTPRKLPDVLSLKEMEEMFEMPFDYRNDEDKAMAESSIMRVLATSGIRVGELSTIEVDLDQKTVRVFGKRQKERIVPIITKWFGEKYTLEAYEYLIENDLQNTPVRTIQRFVSLYGRKLDPKRKITPHTFRHSFATQLIREGVDIVTVKELLGHESIYTTQIYVHLAKRDVIEKLREKGLFD